MSWMWLIWLGIALSLFKIGKQFGLRARHEFIVDNVSFDAEETAEGMMVCIELENIDTINLLVSENAKIFITQEKLDWAIKGVVKNAKV